MSGEPERVLIALSGGVDSSTSAWMLKRDGYQLVGVTLFFHDSERTQAKIAQARHVAELLGIEHHVLDMRERFEQEVERAYIADVDRGVRANPCIRCSSKLKIPALLEQADLYGCSRVATGHYANVTHDGFGVGLLPRQLRSGADRSKDQTFLLYRLSQEQLARLMFPLAPSTKGVVRRTAMQAGLQRLSPLNDGQGIPCFFDDLSAEEWIAAHDGKACAEGPIIDISSGVQVGTHQGLFRYAPGQKLPGGGYVVSCDWERNVLFAGPRAYGARESVVLTDVHWTSIEPPSRRRSCRARIGYDANLVPAHVLCTEEGVVVAFTTPVLGLYAGLDVVLYSDDLVLGGGIVVR